LIRRLRDGTKQGIYFGVVLLLRVVLRLLFRVRIEGRERLRGDLSVIAVARHRSYWDIPLMAVAMGWRNRTHFIARKGLMRNNILVRPFIRAFTTQIDRENFRKSDFRRMLEAIRRERLVAIFPEGTTRAKADAKGGAIHFARLADKELLPVNITSEGAYPPKYPFGFSQVVVKIGAPIGVGDLLSGIDDTVSRADAQRIASERLMQRVDTVGMMKDKGIEQTIGPANQQREGKTVGG